MKLCMATVDGQVHVARVEGDSLALLPFSSMSSLLSQPDWRTEASQPGPLQPIAGVRLAPPVDPGKIICVGLNYRSHILETGRPLPEYPTLFAKFAESLTGPNDEIRLTPTSQEVDWEVELGVVIGRRTRNVDGAGALDAIAGYTVVNDVSMRDWQLRTPQWLQGKTFEASTPVGPVLVTSDEIDPAEGLRITCRVDDQTMQSGTTADLLFGSAALISYISRFITLNPGDLIATGTPGGIGNAQVPKRFLRAGETLYSEIEGIGTLRNRAVDAMDPATTAN